MTPPMTATIADDGASVVLSSPPWRLVVTAAALPDWLRLYRRLWARSGKGPGQPGPWAAFYAEDVRVLERVARALVAGRTGGVA